MKACGTVRLALVWLRMSCRAAQDKGHIEGRVSWQEGAMEGIARRKHQLQRRGAVEGGAVEQQVRGQIGESVSIR
jgi:hypothetical protein